MTHKLMAAPPDVLRWSPRSDGHGDCALSALSLACGVTYEIALAAALKVDPDILIAGLTMREIQRVLRNLGFKGRYARQVDLDEGTGILSVSQSHVKSSGHVVYLWEGRIVEPMHDRQQLWLQAAAYLSHFKYKTEWLLTVKEDE